MMPGVPQPAEGNILTSKYGLLIIAAGFMVLSIIIVFVTGADEMLEMFYKMFAWAIPFGIGVFLLWWALKDPNMLWLKLVAGLSLIGASFFLPGLIG